jgi:hypothetical protein
MREEGHYYIRRVPKLPKKGNANALYAIIGSTINEFFRWVPGGKYETITIGGSGIESIQAGTNVTITGTGTLGDPIIISSIDTLPTGLEALDEGNGIGWRLIARDPLNYGNVGLNSIDLSFISFPNSIYGVTGDYGMALGFNPIVSGDYSFGGGVATTVAGNRAFGYGSSAQASGDNSIAVGNVVEASGDDSQAFGNNTIASARAAFASGISSSATGEGSSVRNIGNFSRSYAEMSIGLNATDYTATSINSHSPTDRVFNVGNGVNSGARSDAFTVLKNGNIAIGINNFEANDTGEELQVNGSVKASNLNLTGLPVHTDEAAAIVGGLATGDVYMTATGELRIKL